MNAKVASNTKQSGFSLIELMISITIGLIIIAAATTVYILIFTGSTNAIRSSRLNYDIDSLMQLMTNDIRRAGYWGGAVSGADPQDNPSSSGDKDLITPNSSCILYSYDVNGDGALDTSNELLGFRLSGSAVEIRLGGSLADPDNCNHSDNVWEPVTVTANNEQVNVTALAFEIVYFCENVNDGASIVYTDEGCETSTDPAAVAPASGDRLAFRRAVNITLTAKSNRDGDITREAISSVVVANDRVAEEP